jgi:BMFP domain-containing protein YqiC
LRARVAELEAQLRVAAELRARVAELEAQLRVAAVRTEVAAILPHTAAAAEKKTP